MSDKPGDYKAQAAMTPAAPPEKMTDLELINDLEVVASILTRDSLTSLTKSVYEAARRLAPRVGDDRLEVLNYSIVSAPPAASADAEARCLICGAIDGHRQPCTAFMPIGPTAASAERETMAAREGWFRAATFYVDLNAESDPAVVAEADKRWPLSALPKGQEHEG